MTNWTIDELESVGGTDELGISARRADGTLRRYVTIWVVRVGDELYVRSAHGVDNPWYRRAVASGEGGIRSAGVEKDVSFEDAAPHPHAEIDAAYHAKYDRYGARVVRPVVGEHSYAATIRLVPAG